VWALRNDQLSLEATLQGHTNVHARSALFNTAGDRIATLSIDAFLSCSVSAVQVWHYGWLVDTDESGNPCNLAQAMFCILAQREYENAQHSHSTPLALNNHRHLLPIWESLPDATQQYLIDKYKVFCPVSWQAAAQSSTSASASSSTEDVSDIPSSWYRS
jgi:hypothetical protein